MFRKKETYSFRFIANRNSTLFFVFLSRPKSNSIASTGGKEDKALLKI